MRNPRDVPTIGWIIFGMLAVLLVSVVSVVVMHMRDDRVLERRVVEADSAAHVHRMEAVILRRDAAAAAARADSVERRADSTARLLATAREDITAKVARAAASSAKVDRSQLRPEVLEALEDADALRTAIAEYLPRDSTGIALYQTVAADRAQSIEFHVGAGAEQGAALIAQDAEIRALEQQHAPRCGWKCGAVIGASVAAVVFGGLTYLVVAAAAAP